MAVPDITLSVGVRDATKAGLAGAEKSVNSFSTRAGKALNKIKGPALLIAGALGGIATGGVIAAKELQALSQAAGIDFGDFQRFDAVIQDLDGDTEAAGDALREMQLRLTEATELGTGPAIDALDVLGVSLSDLAGKTPIEQFNELQRALSTTQVASTRLFAAEELFGGASERLQPILTTSAEKYQTLTKRYEDLNVVTDEQITRIEDNERVVKRFSDGAGRVLTDWLGRGIDAFDGMTGEAELNAEAMGVNEETLERHIEVLGRENDGLLESAKALGDLLVAYFSSTKSASTLIEEQEDATLAEAVLRAKIEETSLARDEDVLVQQAWIEQSALTRAEHDLLREATTLVIEEYGVLEGQTIPKTIAAFELVEEAMDEQWKTSGDLVTRLAEVSGAYNDLTTAKNAATSALSAADVLSLTDVTDPGTFRSSTQAQRRDLARRQIAAGQELPTDPLTIDRLAAALADEVPHRATGGIVTRPTLAVVGERGPEAIVPLDGGMQQRPVHITIQGDVYGLDDFEDRVARAVNRGRQFGAIG